MVKASSFTLLFAFSAVMIEGAPLTARSKEHRTKDNAPADESKLQSNINGGQFAPDLPGSNPNLNYDQQGPGVRCPGVRSNGQRDPLNFSVAYGGYGGYNDNGSPAGFY